MLYQIIKGTVTLGGETILSDIDFEIKGKEKIAIVGRNGAGKTTLLRLIAGELELEPDDRQISRQLTASRKLTIGMLRQSNPLEQNKTVEEIMLEGCPCEDRYARERFQYEMEYHRIFTGFGFELKEKERKFGTFSGGEQTKISLIRLLLMKPDILLLDEPTNHLDIQTAEWLEQYMKEYDKAAVFVSHDRFFLDQVVDAVYELQNKTLKRYPGNYTNYRRQKQKDIQLQTKAYEKQQAELQRLNQLIEKFRNKPRKAAFAKSRKTILDRMERIGKPDPDDVHIFAGEIEPEYLGSKWVLEAEHLKIGYKKVLLELSLRVKRGQKIGIIGDNGVGKSTFLKTVVGNVSPIGGKLVWGNQIMTGYFDQQTASIESEKQVAEHFHDLFPSLTEKEVRQTLGAYLFHGRDTAKKVSALSGGEKARLVLAELLNARPNLLVLDEPTNHMDIQAKETLESAFRSYKGTMLFVSHDRYFVQQVADAILVFEGQSAWYYPFGYDHYLSQSRKKQGESPVAMLQAEEQALISGLQAVPKAERHRLREYGTEELYLDWKLRLAAEPMNEAKAKVELLWNQWESMQDRLQEALWNPDISEEELAVLQEEGVQLKECLEQAWEEWTACCLVWAEEMFDVTV